MRESQDIPIDQWGFAKKIFRWDSNFCERSKLRGLRDLLQGCIPNRKRKKQFVNLYSPNTESYGLLRKVRDAYNWLFSSCKTSFTEFALSKNRSEKQFFSKLRERCGPFMTHLDQPIVSWMGHSTFLLQIFGMTLLTDPIWSPCVGPYPFGLRRSCPAPMSLEALGEVNFVIISHDHADHFDSKTLSALSRANPQSQLIVPEGMGSQVGHLGMDFIELSWGETCRFSSKDKSTIVDVSSIPVIHNSGRGIFDRNASSWCGWICSFQKKESKKKTFFFAGDTAFSDVLFNQVGNQFGPIDLSLLPVGAYLPRSLLGENHVEPEEAVRIHKLTRSRKSIACHHSTFRLSDFVEEEKRLLYDLYSGCEKYCVPENEFTICPVGYWMNW